MSEPWQTALLFVAAYLFGGIPFGLLVGKAKGIDIREHGSKNVGATNVGRVLGRRWGILVFLLDVAKGAATTIAAGQWQMQQGASPMQRDWLWLGSGLACVIGNVAPIYLCFHGGKGVATSLGAIIGIYPYLTFPAIAVFTLWGVLVKLTGYVSLASILASAALPFVFAALAENLGWSTRNHYPLLGLCIALALTVLIRHRQNLGRLLAGTENKIRPGT